jgi:hypothetical protein
MIHQNTSYIKIAAAISYFVALRYFHFEKRDRVKHCATAQLPSSPAAGSEERPEEQRYQKVLAKASAHKA